MFSLCLSFHLSSSPLFFYTPRREQLGTSLLFTRHSVVKKIVCSKNACKQTRERYSNNAAGAAALPPSFHTSSVDVYLVLKHETLCSWSNIVALSHRHQTCGVFLSNVRQDVVSLLFSVWGKKIDNQFEILTLVMKALIRFDGQFIVMWSRWEFAYMSVSWENYHANWQSLSTIFFIVVDGWNCVFCRDKRNYWCPRMTFVGWDYTRASRPDDDN